MVIVWKCLNCGAIINCEDDLCHVAPTCECGSGKEDMELVEED